MKFKAERMPELKAGKHEVNAVSIYVEAETDEQGVVIQDAVGNYIPTTIFLNFAEECNNAKFQCVDVTSPTTGKTFPGKQGLAEFKEVLCEIFGEGQEPDIPAFDNYPVKCKMTGKLNLSKDGNHLNWANRSLKAVQE